MLFASDDAGNRVLARPKARALCPVCGQTVYARCASNSIWHWAHQSKCGCGHGLKGETFWHLLWKMSAPPEAREVSRGGHRVDLIGRSGRAIELQHSRIDPRVVRDRERALGDMMWLFDSANFARYLKVEAVEPSGDGEGGIAWCALRWPRPWPEIVTCRRAVYIDLDPLLPGFVYQVDSSWTASDRKQLSGRLYFPADLVSWFLYPRYQPDPLPFQRVRILAGLRAVGPALRRHVAQQKGVAAWVTDDSLVRWRRLAEAVHDWYWVAKMLVGSQDVVVIVPREISGDVAHLDGFQPPAVAHALALGRDVYVWWDRRWYRTAGDLTWSPEVYDEEDWGVFCEMPGDELLKGLLKVERGG